MAQSDADNMRSMMQMRDRSPIENAAYALGALSMDDKVKAVDMFNRIWGDTTMPRYTTVSIKFVGYDK